MASMLGAAAVAGVAQACSGTGPDAPPRANGCVDENGTGGCTSFEAGAPTEGGGPVPDGGTDAPIVYPHPLDGTSKTATKLVGSLSFTEGPVWIGGRLLFTDIPTNRILELGDGGTTTFRNNSGGANGLAVDTSGRLIACEGGARRVTRSLPASGAAANPIVDSFGGKKLNSPNDVVVRADGNLYFTDPNYGGADGASNQLPFEGAYRIDKFGVTTRLAGTFTRANGIALSPDQNTLYVVDNGAAKLLSAPVNADGTVGAFTVLADLGANNDGDGMAVDDAGNLYVTVKAGVQVFDKAGAKLGTITVPAPQPTNCTFGGSDRKTLFITANAPAVPVDGGTTNNPATGLYSIELNVPGLP